MNTTPPLQEDVGLLKGMGVNAGMYSSEDASHVVRFALDTAFLNKFTARQWGIVPKKPVVVQLKFEDTYTAADDIPGVFIFQSSDKRLLEPSLNDYETEFGVVQWFLETRLTEVLRSNWEKRPAAVRDKTLHSSPFKTSPSAPSSSATVSPSNTPTKVTTTSTTTTSTSPPSAALGPRRDSCIDTSLIPVDDTLLDQLKGVGFSEDQCRVALRRFTNDFEMALNYLLTTPADQNGSSQSLGVNDTSIAIDTVPITTDTDAKMESKSEGSAVSDNERTPDKGKKRSLTVSDDDHVARLIGMGFDLDEVTEVLAAHPPGTSFEVLHDDINTRSAHTPKKRKNSAGEDEKLGVLKGLGFTPSEAAAALEMAQGDLAKAVELADSFKVPYDDGDADEEIPAPHVLPRTRRANARSRRAAAAYDDSNLPNVINPDDIPPAKNEVNLWTEEPFLVNLYNYINMRFITCPGFCLICDRDLDITTYKLPVCGRAECVRVYESTACGKNQVITELKEQPAVVELLLNLLSACMTSPGLKGWNRNGNVLSTHIDGSDGSGTGGRMAYRGGGRRGRVVYTMPAGPQGTTTQSFEPFPYNLGFEFDNGVQNIKLLRQTVDAIPAIRELHQCSSDVHLQAVLDEAASPLAFPLLRWLLRSSRAHLSLIPDNKQIVEMGTPYQFQIVSTNPEHERTFQKWKQQAREEKPNLTAAQRQHNMVTHGFGVVQPQYVPRPGGGFMIKTEEKKAADGDKPNTGSFHAFHGSPISNWHSIVRTGLRGGHVPGIYMAQAAAVSQGYMQTGTEKCSGWRNSTWGCDQNMSCMGMVEVADMCHHQKLLTGPSPPDLPEPSLPGVVNVAMDYSLVVTRYLFFWPRGLFPDVDVAGTPFAYAASPFQNVIASKLITSEFLFLGDQEEDSQEDARLAQDDAIHTGAREEGEEALMM